MRFSSHRGFTASACTGLLAVAVVGWLATSPVAWSQQDNPFGSPSSPGEDPFGGSDLFGGSQEAPANRSNDGSEDLFGESAHESDDKPAAPIESCVDCPHPTAVPACPVYWADNSPQTQKIRQTLASPLAKLGLEFQDAPLSEVVDFLKAEYHIEIQLDNAALDDLGLSPDEPIIVNLRNIPLGSALRILLRQLELTYIVENDVLLITSEDEALTKLQVAVYPVGDITADPTNPKVPHDYDSLLDCIISTVASDSWVENGGPEGEIRPLQPGLLVINQTEKVHEQIQKLLTALRQAKSDEQAVPFPENQHPRGMMGGEMGGRGGGEFGGRGGGGGGGGFGSGRGGE